MIVRKKMDWIIANPHHRMTLLKIKMYYELTDPDTGDKSPMHKIAKNPPDDLPPGCILHELEHIYNITKTGLTDTEKDPLNKYKSLKK